jgi:hypothetical protein
MELTREPKTRFTDFNTSKKASFRSKLGALFEVQ